MGFDPQKPPPWKSPGFLPLMLLMLLASAMMVARGGRREVVFGEATPRGRGLGDVPFRPRVSASASASAAPPAPSASASRGP